LILADSIRRHREALEDALAAIDQGFGAAPTSFNPDHFDRLVEEIVQRNAVKCETHARALWRDAWTPELRAHLRLIYPALFKDAPAPSPRRSCTVARGPDYPNGFHDWSLEKRNGWYAAFNQDRIKREREADK
jgi:hypothetical protein